VNALQGLIDDMHASIRAQHTQSLRSISKSKLSTHCIAMAKMVAYRARILNFLQLHPVMSIIKEAHKELLQMG
jgi:hypothetical protein